MKREFIANDAVYHVFNKSIAGYKIFNDDRDYRRIVDLLVYYQIVKPPARFSHYIALKEKDRLLKTYPVVNHSLVSILAYCIMPTHLHIVLKQLKTNGISTYMGNVLNSYSRYFNTRNSRKGPLWQSRFKHVAIDSDEELSHLTRYIHLNPVTGYLCEDPGAWVYSSYREYIGESANNICTQDFRLFKDASAYRKFVLDQKDYQRSLAKTKELSLE